MSNEAKKRKNQHTSNEKWHDAPAGAAQRQRDVILIKAYRASKCQYEKIPNASTDYYHDDKYSCMRKVSTT